MIDFKLQGNEHQTPKSKRENTGAQKLGIHFGCLAEPIKKQLNDQGFILESKDEEYLQRVADAINFLKFGYINGSVVDSAQKKLIKKIAAAAKPIKKED